jgi:hypothetical protein
LSGEKHRSVEEHDNGGKKGTLACPHKVISSNSGSTGLASSINRSDRSMKDMVVGFHQEEKHDIIHIRFLVSPTYLTRYAAQVIYLIPSQIIWFQLIHIVAKL